MTLKIEKRPIDGGAVQIVLEGALDEQAFLEPTFETLTGLSAVEIDLTAVKRLNPIGLKKWVPVIKSVSRQSSATVTGVPFLMAVQASLTCDLFGDAAVLSCHAPFFCSTCDTETMVLVTVDQLKTAGGIPSLRCEACNGPLFFNEAEDFFDFMISL